MPVIKDVLNKDYALIEAAIAKRIIRQPVSCKKGCAHCCYLFALITIADAINIADEILTSWTHWKPVAYKMKIAALQMSKPGMDAHDWFALQRPCVFLSENDICNIYSVRPAECRFYYVISPAIKCSIAYPGEKVARYDFLEAEKHIWKLSIEIQREHPEIIGPPMPLVAAPLPLMVLHAMKAVLAKDKKRRKYITELIQDLPSPQDFIQDQMIQIRRKHHE